MNSKIKISYLVGLLAVVLALLSGCNHKDYPTQTDEGHIENYILNENKGIDLFRPTGIYPSTPYQWPGDPAIYYDSVTSVNREFETFVSDSSWNYGNYGWLFEGVCRVTDVFQVRRFRVSGSDTTFTDEERVLIRSGYFLKLGRDSDYNYGWDLWGMGYFNQAYTELDGALWFPDSTSMRADFDLYDRTLVDPNLRAGRYKQLFDFKVIPDSTECRIDVEIANISVPTRYYTRVSYPTNDRYASVRLGPTDQTHATGTMILREHPEPAYDFVVISIYDSITKEFIRSWAIPYRINPIT